MLNIINRIKQRFLQKKFKSLGFELITPFYISDIKHIVHQKPVYVGPNAWMELRGKLYIYSGTIIGPRLKVHTSNHNYNGILLPYDEKYLVKDVIIHENVWIGSDVTILPGVEIGEGAVIGACSVVTKSIPALAIVGGNPARIIKYRDENQYRLKKKENKIYLKYKIARNVKLNENNRIVHV